MLDPGKHASGRKHFIILLETKNSFHELVIYYSKSWRMFSNIYKTFENLKEGLVHAGAQKNNFTTLKSLTSSYRKRLQKLYKAIYKKRIKRDYGVLSLLILVPLVALRTIPKAIIPINWLRT